MIIGIILIGIIAAVGSYFLLREDKPDLKDKVNKSEVWREGYDAYFLGMDIDDNPYWGNMPESDENLNEWTDGFEFAYNKFN